MAKQSNLEWYLALYLMYMVGSLAVGFFITALADDWSIMRPAMLLSLIVPFVPIIISAIRNRKGVK